MQNISLATRCLVRGTVYSDQGVYIETQDGQGVKLTGNHPVYTANKAVTNVLVHAHHFQIGWLVYNDQEKLVRVTNVTQLRTPMVYYDVVCGGGGGDGDADLMANGIKTRTGGW